MQSVQNIHTNIRPEERFRKPYKNHRGGDNPHWAVFFADPVPQCKRVLSAESTLKREDLIDSVWNRYIAGNHLFYNTFLCEEGVAHYTYDRRAHTLRERIIAFDDEDFTKKLPKEPYAFYRLALESFLQKAKTRLERGGTVKLFFHGYEMTISKTRFVVEKDGETVIDNHVETVEYNDLGELVVNPHTDKSLHLDVPETVYDFFRYYLQIRHPKLKKELPDTMKKSEGRRFIEEIGFGVVWLVTLFGLMLSFWYLDGYLTNEISPVRMAVEGFVALITAEILYGIFKSKAM